MVLQIEKPETLRLVEKLSHMTGESAEAIVAVALRERLDRMEQMDEDELQRRAEIYALVKELGAMFREAPDLVTDHGELLYGEDGLPR